MKHKNALLLFMGLGAGLFAAPPRIFRDVAAANAALLDAIKDGDTARVAVALHEGFVFVLDGAGMFVDFGALAAEDAAAGRNQPFARGRFLANFQRERIGKLQAHKSHRRRIGAIHERP